MSDSKERRAFLNADKKRISASIIYRQALAEFWNAPNTRAARERLHRTERNYLKARDAAEVALHAWQKALRAKE